MITKIRTPIPGLWERAKCNSVDVSSDDPFFSDDEDDIQDAKDFCNGTIDGIVCPLRQECLMFALSNPEKYGVWGGTDALTRRAIRRRHQPLPKIVINPNWKWQTQEQALSGFTSKDIRAMKESLNDKDN